MEAQKEGEKERGEERRKGLPVVWRKVMERVDGKGRLMWGR